MNAKVLYKITVKNKIIGYKIEINGIGYRLVSKAELRGYILDNAKLTKNGRLLGNIPSLERRIIKLYHGSPNRVINPTFGMGKDMHDYGRGFYLTPNLELAKEWATCSGSSEGYVHAYLLDLTDLNVMDFDKTDVLHWLAELMKHRDAADSTRYKKLAPLFIEKYKINTDKFDVIKGWRADSSYFYIGKAFARDEVDVSILDRLLKIGDLGVQYCIKSKKAYDNLYKHGAIKIDNMEEYTIKYNQRDTAARNKMRELIESKENTCRNTFSSLI